MNIAIIDDISTDAEALKNITVSYFEKKQIRAEICHFFSAEEFFEDYQPGKFQILFLDIYMDGMTGMEAARRIRRQSDNCILVFVTTSGDFAVESYDVGASYYLLKPFQPEKLCSILDSFQSRHLLASRYIEVVSPGSHPGPSAQHFICRYIPKCSVPSYRRRSGPFLSYLSQI